ncbi:hypothetical protein BB559_002422 [Furculomyces boomerangus]|uniref:Uncharacterized protein n=2 Tax=Harpellales TaxID=61421 RepID=A0A2T9YV92_9FUNG|nr:hypothetical protein BB559_002422 [Furculomyces boomerangus]PVZ99959.1 hypothetical protein BB558_004003 [Smittium angustum]
MTKIILFLFNLFLAKACIEYVLSVRSDDKKTLIRVSVVDDGYTKILKSEDILKFTENYQCWEGKDNYKFCVNHREKTWELWKNDFYSKVNLLNMTEDKCSFEDPICSTTYSDRLYCNFIKDFPEFKTQVYNEG